MRGRPQTKVSPRPFLLMVHLPTFSLVFPSETAPLLQDVDHPDADSRPHRSSFTSIIQEPLTPLTKVLLVVALLFLLLSSIFIGLFAGAQHKLNSGRGQEPPVTVTSTVHDTATATQTQTQTRTQTATSTTVSTSTVSVPAPVPTGPHEEVSKCSHRMFGASPMM